MVYVYNISIKDPEGRFKNFCIAASTRAKAETKACELAGVPADTEPHTCQRQSELDAIVAD